MFDLISKKEQERIIKEYRLYFDNFPNFPEIVSSHIDEIYWDLIDFSIKEWSNIETDILFINLNKVGFYPDTTTKMVYCCQAEYKMIKPKILAIPHKYCKYEQPYLTSWALYIPLCCYTYVLELMCKKQNEF